MIHVRVPQGASPKIQAPYTINVKLGIGSYDDYIEYTLTFSTPTLHGLYVFIVWNLFGCCCAILPTTFCHNDESCNDEVGVKLWIVDQEEPSSVRVYQLGGVSLPSIAGYLFFRFVVWELIEIWWEDWTDDVRSGSRTYDETLRGVFPNVLLAVGAREESLPKDNSVSLHYASGK